ncbi:ATP synthase-coupling factor 6, mitochondrial [Manis javanica]|nr:ATP synthase-coupling factor 6, mitochondrial [Manis javanica]
MAGRRVRAGPGPEVERWRRRLWQLKTDCKSQNHHDSSEALQKLFLDKIREYRTKRQSSAGPVDTGPEYQQDLERELFKLKQMYGKGDMTTFPNFKFEDPKFEVIEKPQS